MLYRRLLAAPLLFAVAASALRIPVVPVVSSLWGRTFAPRAAPKLIDSPPLARVHGDRGAYVGGHWVPLADCPTRFNIADGSHTRPDLSDPCPRSRTRHSAAKADGSYDVAIVGAGCIGAAIARELAKTTASVVLIEAADDVSQGATKGNSGIAGTTRARLCWRGNQLFPRLDEELHFGYQLTGSMVLAKGSEDEAHLEDLLARGEANGVKNLRIVRGDELRRLEPHIDPAVTAALHSPDAGTLIPYEYAIALAENAADNGVEVRIRRELEEVRRTDDGNLELHLLHWEPREWLDEQASRRAQGRCSDCDDSGTTKGQDQGRGASAALGYYYGGDDEGGPWQDHPELKRSHQRVTVDDMKVGGSGSRRAAGGVPLAHETVRARLVVNCAGGASDRVARMVGDASFEIKPRLGEYVMLKKTQGHLCNHILFPCPGPYGKGILVQKTLWGNIILGPTARDQHNWPDPRTDPDTKADVLAKILTACRGLVPDLDATEAFHSFSGARAKSSRGDWIIERCATEPRMIHAAGIDSPGIAASPAIAEEVVHLLREAGLDAGPDPGFNPRRAPLVVPKNGDEGLVFTPDAKTSINSAGAAPGANVLCKCEKVTEAEVVAACRRSLPVDSTQAIRKRTRAGMGGCQGKPWNYGCECRVAQVVAREQPSTTPTPAAVGRRPWRATSLFDRRWLSPSDKEALGCLSRGQVTESQAKAAARAVLQEMKIDSDGCMVPYPHDNNGGTGVAAAAVGAGAATRSEAMAAAVSAAYGFAGEGQCITRSQLETLVVEHLTAGRE